MDVTRAWPLVLVGACRERVDALAREGATPTDGDLEWLRKAGYSGSYGDGHDGGHGDGYGHGDGDGHGDGYGYGYGDGDGGGGGGGGYGHGGYGHGGGGYGHGGGGDGGHGDGDGGGGGYGYGYGSTTWLAVAEITLADGTTLRSRDDALEHLRMIAALCASIVTCCPACGAEPWVNIDCDLCLVATALTAGDVP